MIKTSYTAPVFKILDALKDLQPASDIEFKEGQLLLKNSGKSLLKLKKSAAEITCDLVISFSGGIVKAKCVTLPVTSSFIDAVCVEVKNVNVYIPLDDEDSDEEDDTEAAALLRCLNNHKRDDDVISFSFELDTDTSSPRFELRYFPGIDKSEQSVAFTYVGINPKNGSEAVYTLSSARNLQFELL